MMMMMVITLDGRRRVPNPLSRQVVLHKRDDWIACVCAGSSGPCSRVLASLGSRDSEPTAGAGQFSGKQQQQVFVFFIIENVGEMNGNEAFIFLLHLPELCVESIASWKLSVQK
jgi:hypothetical protein